MSPRIPTWIKVAKETTIYFDLSKILGAAHGGRGLLAVYYKFVLHNIRAAPYTNRSYGELLHQKQSIWCLQCLT